MELVLSDLTIDKNKSSDYNEKQYLEDYLTNQGMQIDKNTVTVNGWQFEIDRNTLEIVSKFDNEPIYPPQLTPTPEPIEDDGNKMVAFFNTVYTNATTSARNIAIQKYNSKYSTTTDNRTLTINKSGTYTAYVTVGHSPKNGAHTTTGYLYINNEPVELVKQCYHLSYGTKSYTFTVEEDQNVTLHFSVVADGNYATGSITSFGSVILVKN